MASEKTDDKHGPRMYTTPHDGSRSPAFISFHRNFRVGARAHFLPEDDSSVWSALEDTHQGGQAQGAPALPAQGQAGYAGAIRKYIKRIAVAFQMVYLHFDDEDMRATMDALPDDDRKARAAWLYALACCENGTSDLEWGTLVGTHSGA
jgi:hypothetical protein